MKKYISYSEMALWEWDRDEYIRRYIKGEESPKTREMEIGLMIHGTIENPKYDWLKEARRLGFRGKKMKAMRLTITKCMRIRADEQEVALMGKLDDEISIYAKMDGFNKATRELEEYKTTETTKWKDWMVQQNFQLDVYGLAYYLSTRQYFKEIRLREIAFGKGNITTFKTTRSWRDNQQTKNKIYRIVGEMKAAGIWSQRLSRNEREQLKQGRLI